MEVHFNRQAVIFAVLMCVGIYVTNSLLSACAQEQAGAQKKTLRKEFRPQQEQTGAPVIATYDAVTYDPLLPVTAIERGKWDRSTAESAYRGLFTAYKQGNADWILAAMTSAEREKKRPLVGKKELLDKNTLAYNTIVSQFLVQKILYGNYAILRVVNKTKDGKTWNQDLTFKKTTDGWSFTNELADDPFVGSILPTLELGNVRLPQ